MPELAGIFLGEEVYWIPGFIGSYGVTKTGKVISYKRGISKLSPNNVGGYMKIGLSRSDWLKPKGIDVHRLVAATFLGLDLNDSLTQVDHINGVKNDNNLHNLRLCSASQNINWKNGFGDNDSEFVKECRSCRQVFPRSKFRPSTKQLDGFRPYCCRS